MAARKGEVQYRDRFPGELEEAARLIDRVFREEFDIDHGEKIRQEVAEAEARFDRERDLFTTAELEGKTVGALLVSHDDARAFAAAQLSWLVVDPAVRGRGVGRELLFRCVDACRERRIPVLRARSFALSPAAPRLFWMYGFKVIDLAPTLVAGRPRETIHFEKRLPPPAAT